MKHQLVDGMLLDMETLRVVSIDSNNNHTSIRLSKAEANILFFLFNNKGKIVSKNKLVEIGWGDRKVGANSMNVAIYNLRKCFNTNDNINLDNIPKIGYKLSISSSVIDTSDLEAVDTHNEDIKEFETKQHPLKKSLIHLMKLSTLIILNLIIIKFLFISYINLVTVNCIDNDTGSVCYSKSYQGEKGITSPGVSVLSNLFSFTNTNISREAKQ